MAKFVPAPRPREMRVKRNRGFTLVEVLVALAVIAIAFGAIMRTLAQSIDVSANLRDRALAMWVAQNRLARQQADRAWPSADTREGTDAMGGREWRWRELVANTPDADLRRIEIQIRAIQGDAVLARLVGFLARP
jgi:general secretion pathway protein I